MGVEGLEHVDAEGVAHLLEEGAHHGGMEAGQIRQGGGVAGFEGGDAAQLHLTGQGGRLPQHHLQLLEHKDGAGLVAGLAPQGGQLVVHGGAGAGVFEGGGGGPAAAPVLRLFAGAGG